MDHINEISPEELQELVEEDKDVVIVDVREDDEVAQGMIEDAKHIPLREIPQTINDLDKDKHYVLVCRSGNRSMKAAAFMDEHGYKVTNMTGGMLNWDGEVVF
ncbi:rhodanese-like domain-containing protein [Virgibacillus ndiopensis]|uniref:rhodanese-like domain-containing protein n=1 Tax=Virgibacillus ndiopensis TaxID=2004408 RepID=UPI000C06A552|nr:rhodanese-like domain-containing protein [Virgibacillus ndiopensis]